jgi:hypothetical protein
MPDPPPYVLTLTPTQIKTVLLGTPILVDFVALAIVIAAAAHVDLFRLYPDTPEERQNN